MLAPDWAGHAGNVSAFDLQKMFYVKGLNHLFRIDRFLVIFVSIQPGLGHRLEANQSSQLPPFLEQSLAEKFGAQVAQEFFKLIRLGYVDVFCSSYCDCLKIFGTHHRS